MHSFDPDTKTVWDVASKASTGLGLELESPLLFCCLLRIWKRPLALIAACCVLVQAVVLSSGFVSQEAYSVLRKYFQEFSTRKYLGETINCSLLEAL